MIGYYVHHQGRGHLHRVTAVAPHLRDLTVLSSLPEPLDWSAEWIGLARDDDAPGPGDVTAHGRLHWVPAGHAGLRRRMATISEWIEAERPSAMVVDVSVEVALLARLHGVPVVVVAQPGERTDAAHRLAHDVADAVLAPWPPGFDAALRMSDEARPRLRHVGALSRFDGRPRTSHVEARTVLVLDGAGGQGLSRPALDAARAATPGWRWTVLGQDHWVDDPWPLLCRAEVVVTHAGQNAVAEVAAARRPAVIMPQPRPHDEQQHLSAALAADPHLPVAVVDDAVAAPWAPLLTSLSDRDGSSWSAWNDGGGAARAAGLIAAVGR